MALVANGLPLVANPAREACARRCYWVGQCWPRLAACVQLVNELLHRRVLLRKGHIGAPGKKDGGKDEGKFHDSMCSKTNSLFWRSN